GIRDFHVTGVQTCALPIYENAAKHFQAYTEKVKDDKVKLNDAYLRLGDSHFVSTKYWPAMEAYNKAIEMKGIDADYAMYQKGIRSEERRVGKESRSRCWTE